MSISTIKIVLSLNYHILLFHYFCFFKLYMHKIYYVHIKNYHIKEHQVGNGLGARKHISKITELWPQWSFCLFGSFFAIQFDKSNSEVQFSQLLKSTALINTLFPKYIFWAQQALQHCKRNLFTYINYAHGFNSKVNTYILHVDKNLRLKSVFFSAWWEAVSVSTPLKEHRKKACSIRLVLLSINL